MASMRDKLIELKGLEIVIIETESGIVIENFGVPTRSVITEVGEDYFVAREKQRSAVTFAISSVKKIHVC